MPVKNITFARFTSLISEKHGFTNAVYLHSYMADIFVMFIATAVMVHIK